MLTISSKVIDDNHRWKYKHDRYKLDDGHEDDYFYCETAGNVLIIPVLDDGRLVLVRQHRYLYDKPSIEFPGGGILSGVPMDEMARRELAEEAGYQAEELAMVAAFAGLNGTAKDMTYLYLATGLTPTERKLERSEQDMEVLWRRPDEFDAMIKNNEIWCGRTLAAWAIARGSLIQSENL